MSKMSCEEHKVFGPIEILFDFLKNRKYNDYKRVASTVSYTHLKLQTTERL